MLNKKQIIEEFKALNKRAGFKLNIAGTHGVSMVMHDIKEFTGDIDTVIMDEKTRKWVLDNVTPIEYDGYMLYEQGAFDFGYPAGDNKLFTELPDYTGDDFETIDGVKCVKLERVIEEKKLLNRPKDRDAIKLIRDKIGYGSVFLGDDHTQEFWEQNHEALRDFKPDYLLLEVIGRHRYLNANERRLAMSTDVYMDNPNHQGYNSDAFKLAEDLDVPMIGIDTWDMPYVYNDGFTIDEMINDEKKLYESHRIREKRMATVAKEFIDKGKVLLIVGAEHLRDNSELTKFAKGKADVKFFKL